MPWPRGRERSSQEGSSGTPFFPHSSHGNLHYGRGFIKIRKNNPTYKKKTKPAGETSPNSHPPTLPLLPWCREGTRGAWEGKGQAVLPGLPSPSGRWGQGDGHVAHHCWGARMEQSSPHKRFLSSHLSPSVTDFLWPLTFGTRPPHPGEAVATLRWRGGLH